jgi:hypothetical protein
MNPSKKLTRHGMARISSAYLTLLVMLSLFSIAKDKPSDYDAQRVSVIAHLPVAGNPVNRMFVQEQGGKQYLYMQQASHPGYTIVDVSRANKPKVVKRGAFENHGTSDKFQMMSGGIALAETPASAGTGSSRHELAAPKTAGAASTPESVRVLDMSDPANPRTLQTFEGVTSILAEDSRSLIYIANGEGLWILRHLQERPPLPKCDSESVFSPIADCQ